MEAFWFIWTCLRFPVSYPLCVCVVVVVGGGGSGGIGKWGGGGGAGSSWIAELWMGNNVMRLFSLLYIAAFHTVHVHYFPCVALVANIYGLFVCCLLLLLLFFVVLLLFLACCLRYFCHRWKCRRMLKSAVKKKKQQHRNKIGEWLKWEEKKERKKKRKKKKAGGGGGGGGRRRINTIPAVGNGVGASSLEIRTRNCFKSPIQPVCCVWAIETKTIKLRWVSVPSQGLWYQQWDKTEIHPKSSNKSRLRLVDIGGSGGACGWVYHGKHVEKVWRHRRRLRLAWEWPRRVQCKLKLAMPVICIVISNFF